jgi:4'-phosphopantetheinyl transferase EntD
VIRQNEKLIESEKTKNLLGEILTTTKQREQLSQDTSRKTLAVSLIFS